MIKISNIKLITNEEIKELRTQSEGCNDEKLVHKLHESYNALKIIITDLKRENDRFKNLDTEYEKLMKRYKQLDNQLNVAVNEINELKRENIKLKR